MNLNDPQMLWIWRALAGVVVLALLAGDERMPYAFTIFIKGETMTFSSRGFEPVHITLIPVSVGRCEATILANVRVLSENVDLHYRWESSLGPASDWTELTLGRATTVDIEHTFRFDTPFAGNIHLSLQLPFPTRSKALSVTVPCP